MTEETCVCSCVSGIRQLGEMFRPDPSDEVAGVILVLSQPQLTLLGDDIEDLKFR